MKVEIHVDDLTTLIELARECNELTKVHVRSRGLSAPEIKCIDAAEEAIDEAVASHHASVDALEREWASKGVKWSH